jgi:NAD(P)H-hydrate epimerase
VALLAEPDPQRCPDAAMQLRLLRRSGQAICDHPEQLSGQPALLIDALLGTGLSRAIEGPVRNWITWIDRTAQLLHLPVLSVDLPSGLHADSGESLGATVRATVTVTFARPKVGLLAPAAATWVGRVLVASLGLPEPALEAWLQNR